MKKKLELIDLSVKSFITKRAESKILGGDKPTANNCASNPCENSLSCYTWGCGGCSDINTPCIG
ncbi:hypothetical protein AB9P05_01865 [Roseivirga sp. BDSF3-8]|uniref:hypothetical protein n=1 Tax=Roseivirga sp. BDSF3-8 TaxID=3241598 RepID=UPI003532067B